MNYKKSIVGGSIAFILATSCCWLPALIITIGGGSTLVALSDGIEKYSSVFMIIGLVFLGYGIYQFNKNNKNLQTDQVILQTTITCPKCGIQKNETMPTNACQYFYECESCKNVIKPIEGDCCVFCSYGTVDCPPIQLNQNCC